MKQVGWGTRIAILYVGFVLLMGVMITMCLNQKIDLVSEDYYQKELVFQNKIEQAKNADALIEKIVYTITNKNMVIVFPLIFKGKQVTGEIIFFRPSDASKDYSVPVKLNEQERQLIPINNLTKGMYKMQISWKVNDTFYFDEEMIVIP